MIIDAITLTKTLIEMRSVTPDDGGSLDYLANLLGQYHFVCERLDQGDTKNLWAYIGNPSNPTIVFLGHIDVVPPGPEDEWNSPPFKATEANGYLYGRGAADMKSGVAAMVSTAIHFATHNSEFPFRVALLLTSDEEGAALHGVRHVMEVFKARHETISYCIVGEPSAKQQLGDTIKIGRRGSLSGKLTILGKQGHIAYPELADNAIHRFASVHKALTECYFDNGNAHFQATRLQFSNIHAGVGVNNVIPGSLVADFNLRFSPESTSESIQAKVEQLLQEAKLNYELTWHLGGLPFLTSQGILIESTLAAIKTITGLNPELSTKGGTSDGRFVAPTGAEVVEVGVCNQSIHQVNEYVKIDDIQKLSAIYYEILSNLMKQLNT